MLPNYPYYQNQMMPGQQQRLNYLEQQQQQQPFMQSPYSGMKGRPVASLEEARASMIDFDGSIFYFPDTANQKIYTKQINMDGTSSLKVYSILETPAQTNNTQDLPYVSKEEFSKTINTLLAEIDKLKGAKVNDVKSDATNDNATYEF